MNDASLAGPDQPDTETGAGQHFFGQTKPAGPVEVMPSIVDTILDLDKFLSGDIRLAEKTARFCTRPDLEAEIEDLNAELDSLTDREGRPLTEVDPCLSGPAHGGRSAQIVASEIVAKQREYGAAMRSIRLRAMDEDDWDAFQTKHKKAFDDGEFPAEFFVELIARCAVAPKFAPEQVPAFRKMVGHASYSEVANTALRVNLGSGVNIPKSLLSSAVLRQ